MQRYYQFPKYQIEIPTKLMDIIIELLRVCRADATLFSSAAVAVP